MRYLKRSSTTLPIDEELQRAVLTRLGLQLPFEGVRRERRTRYLQPDLRLTPLTCLREVLQKTSRHPKSFDLQAVAAVFATFRRKSLHFDPNLDRNRVRHGILDNLAASDLAFATPQALRQVCVPPQAA